MPGEAEIWKWSSSRLYTMSKSHGHHLKISGRNSVCPHFARDSCGTFCTLKISSGLDPWDTFLMFLRPEPSAQCRKSRQLMTRGGKMSVILSLSQTPVPSTARQASGCLTRGRESWAVARRRGASWYPLSARPFGWLGLCPTLPLSPCASPCPESSPLA